MSWSLLLGLLIYNVLIIILFICYETDSKSFQTLQIQLLSCHTPRFLEFLTIDLRLGLLGDNFKHENLYAEEGNKNWLTDWKGENESFSFMLSGGSLQLVWPCGCYSEKEEGIVGLAIYEIRLVIRGLQKSALWCPISRTWHLGIGCSSNAFVQCWMLAKDLPPIYQWAWQ